MDIERILSEMTLEEKAALVSGTDFMHTNPIPRLDVPSLCMSDGPHGLRKQTGSGDNGISQSEPATAFPTAVTTACGWDPENLRKMGAAIAKECRHYGVHTILGPGVNLKRNPLCGRNFEYFSEDPYLSGVLGTSEVDGLQSEGVGACVKHFALNNSENWRFMGNSAASENTIRNLYLKPFEYIVKHARPAAVMCAYNRINGVYCSENRWLLTDVLRGEWGFDGVVMSDWGAVRDRVASLKAGMDLEMPGDTPYCRRQILDAVKDGSLPMEDLDVACKRILEWIRRYEKTADPVPVDWDAHHALSAEIAQDCAVLLKNDGTLPLRGTEKLHIAGELFSNMRYQGAGSSMIRPTRVTSPKDAFDARGITGVPLEESDTVLLFAGLTDEYESEGGDRSDMRLPQDQLDLIERMAQSGKKTVVVLFAGSPVELPFFDKVSAVLMMYLPGQNGGEACARLLFGDVNPSGKLAETWPVRAQDAPGAAAFGKGINEIYSEGLDIGMRWYEKNGIAVRFPFGYGLSYTSFAHSEWEKEGDVYTQRVTNTGTVPGAEVSMLFLDGELKGFEKVFLSPGETKTVCVRITEEAEPVYSNALVPPEEPQRFPLTTESRMSDFRQTFAGRILFSVMLSLPRKLEKQAAKMPDGPEKNNAKKGAQFLRRVMESNSPRSLSMCAGSSFPFNFALGFTELANGHFFRGIGCFLKKLRVPKLPKEIQKKA